MTSGTVKGTSSLLALTGSFTFFPAKRSCSSLATHFKSLLGTLTVSLSSGASGDGCSGEGCSGDGYAGDGCAGEGCAGEGLYNLLMTPSTSSMPSASSSELPPTSFGLSLSSGWRLLYKDGTNGQQVRTSFTRLTLALTTITSDHP